MTRPLLLFRWIRPPIFQLLSINKCHQTVKWSILRWHFLSFSLFHSQFQAESRFLSLSLLLLLHQLSHLMRISLSRRFFVEKEQQRFSILQLWQTVYATPFIVSCAFVKKGERNICNYQNWRVNGYFLRVTINNVDFFFLYSQKYETGHTFCIRWAENEQHKKIWLNNEKFIRTYSNEWKMMLKNQRNSDQMFVDFIRSYFFLVSFACRFLSRFVFFIHCWLVDQLE